MAKGLARGSEREVTLPGRQRFHARVRRPFPPLYLHQGQFQGPARTVRPIPAFWLPKLMVVHFAFFPEEVGHLAQNL